MKGKTGGVTLSVPMLSRTGIFLLHPVNQRKENGQGNEGLAHAESPDGRRIKVSIRLTLVIERLPSN